MIFRTSLAALLASACATTAPMQAVAPPQTAAPSPKEAEVLATVDRFLLALGNHNDVQLEEVLIVEGVSWIQTIEAGAENPVQPYTNDSLLAPDPDADPFMERYWSPTVTVRGGLAHVWAPYEFRDNGEVAHCGIDAFDLVFLDGAWRVSSVMSTVEPDGCARLAPASPADMRPRDGWRETPNN